MSSSITETVEFWDKNYGAQINKEEARQSIKNITGFFQILNKWEQNERDMKRPYSKKTNRKGSSKER
jgi:hypothetical protein